jgi:acyl CoA:acetate/3-ketoacid CoA transferase alpha subunit
VGVCRDVHKDVAFRKAVEKKGARCSQKWKQVAICICSYISTETKNWRTMQRKACEEEEMEEKKEEKRNE